VTRRPHHSEPLNREPRDATNTLMRLRLPSLLLLVLGACATGSPAAAPTTGTPLSAEDRVFFDDGVDFVGDPSVLEGRWRDDWSNELDSRVTHADVVSYVRVQALRTDVDLERRTTYRLLVDEVESIVGELPEDLGLASQEGDGGYITIEGNESRILDEEFVLFLKWEQPSPDAPVRARWHLSPHTEDVTARVEYLAERRRGVERPQPERRIHVHERED
jgi:hypothetical protein